MIDTVLGMVRAAASRRLPLRWRLGWSTARRRVLHSEGFVLVCLSLAAAGAGALFLVRPSLFPTSLLAVVLLAGGFLLSVRSLLLLDVAVVAVVALEVTRTSDVLPGSLLVLAATAAIVHLMARSRGRLGVQGTRGDSMLVDLRDRLSAHGSLPPLPEGWSAEVVLRSAGGGAFSGDFLVAARSDDWRCLEVALVDVSGKGAAAGTRALLLSGAFGGLLGSLLPEDFLPAANRYLLRQEWSEGFATVAHVVLDLRTGDYTVSVAGHPPAVHFQAGSGRWSLVEAGEGPLLGVVPEAKFVGESGRVERGDALLLFTDGLVERPGHDLADGIDRLLGEAERLVTRGFHHGARTLIDRVAAAHNDDRAVFLLWRD